MRIAHVVSTFPPYKGGMGNVAYNFALGLCNLGNEVVVFTPLYRNKKNNNTLDLPNNLQIKRIKPFFEYGNAAVLLGLIKKLNSFDIVHLHYPFYGTAEIIALAKYLGLLKTKLVIHYHMDTKATGLKGRIFAWHGWLLSSWLLNSADMITCASIDYVKHGAIADFYSANPNFFIQIPFGVDLDFFQPSEKKEKRILFVGGLDEAHYFKGVDVLIKSFAKLVNGLPDYRLAIVGKGNLLGVYQQKTRNYKIENKVDFITDADNKKLAELYRSSALAVLPSINCNEAFGLVLLEAMASGLPVVASRLPGVRSVFVSGDHGYLAEPGNADDLAKKIFSILSSEKKQNQFSLAAREYTEKNYSWAKAANKLNEIYLRLKFSPKN